jgi:hypothetical protein
MRCSGRLVGRFLGFAIPHPAPPLNLVVRPQMNSKTKKVIIALAVAPSVWLLYVTIIILWPNPYKKPRTVLQRDFEQLYPIGMPRSKVVEMIEGQHLQFRTLPDSKKITSNYGSYPTDNFYLIFPLSEIVKVTWTFDNADCVESVHVNVFLDGP